MGNYTDLKIGDKLEIQVRKPQAGESAIVSQVADIKGDHIYIADPMKLGMSFRLTVGQSITVVFYRDDKGIFSFSAQVKERIENRLTFYRIEPIKEVEKIQRRNFYRFEAALKVHITKKIDGEEQQGMTSDISGGGMKVRCKKPYDQNTIMDCIIYLGDDQLFVAGKVLRCTFDSESGEYVHSVIFLDIQESSRKKIISFIFEKQRSLRRKGLM